MVSVPLIIHKHSDTMVKENLAFYQGVVIQPC